LRGSADDSPYPQTSFIIRPYQEHEVDAAGILSCFIWLNPDHPIARTFKLKATITAPIAPLEPPLLDMLIPHLYRALKHPMDAEDAAQLFETILHTISFQIYAPRPLDERLHAALIYIRQSNFMPNGKDIQSLARHVYLSPSRLSHLFHEYLGLSLQNYLVWERLLKALHYTSMTGASLNETAHETGFADQAHFTRVFRRTFGLKPSQVFKDSRFVQVIPCLTPYP
jgi:AraC-like DNA-binding protein